jgi:hypothetical protein
MYVLEELLYQTTPLHIPVGSTLHIKSRDNSSLARLAQFAVRTDGGYEPTHRMFMKYMETQDISENSQKRHPNCNVLSLSLKLLFPLSLLSFIFTFKY